MSRSARSTFKTVVILLVSTALIVLGGLLSTGTVKAEMTSWPAPGKCASTSTVIRCGTAKGTKSFAVAGLMMVRKINGATPGPWTVLKDKTRPGKVSIAVDCGGAMSYKTKRSGAFTITSAQIASTLSGMLRKADCRIRVMGLPPTPRFGEETQVALAFAHK